VIEKIKMGVARRRGELGGGKRLFRGARREEGEGMPRRGKRWESRDVQEKETQCDSWSDEKTGELFS